jgi:cytochrome c biogenesis factor
MGDLPFYGLVMTGVLALYAGVGSVIGARMGPPALVASARRSVYVVAAFLTLAIVMLFHAFAVHDFSIRCR